MLRDSVAVAVAVSEKTRKKLASVVHVLQTTKTYYLTLLFCRGRVRKIQRFMTHVHSHVLRSHLNSV